MIFEQADLIFAYTRKQALEDGILVDVTTMAQEAGFRDTTALTHTVHSRYVQIPEGVECQDEAGRLWDILWMLRHAIVHGNGSGSVIYFQVIINNGDPATTLVKLKAVRGPDDEGKPCVTIMLPNED